MEPKKESSLWRVNHCTAEEAPRAFSGIGFGKHDRLQFVSSSEDESHLHHFAFKDPDLGHEGGYEYKVTPSSAKHKYLVSKSLGFWYGNPRETIAILVNLSNEFKYANLIHTCPDWVLKAAKCLELKEAAFIEKERAVLLTAAVAVPIVAVLLNDDKRPWKRNVAWAILITIILLMIYVFRDRLLWPRQASLITMWDLVTLNHTNSFRVAALHPYLHVDSELADGLCKSWLGTETDNID
jgi:hypothetical protein